MKAFEIFQEISPETTQSVFQFLRDEQREVYTASLSSLAANRKLRPVFVQRKPAAAQIEWLAKNIKLRGSAEIAEHVMQLWLMKAHQDVLVQFLDGVGIAHDGEGAAEVISLMLDGRLYRLLGKSAQLEFGSGDVERCYVEWLSLLRHIRHAPDLDSERWLELKAAATGELKRRDRRSPLVTMPDLPASVLQKRPQNSVFYKTL